MRFDEVSAFAIDEGGKRKCEKRPIGDDDK
jgi:hypothetical protein